ncbi:MAG TPA: hypothetical protein VK986_19670, partial [Tepidisphaeraceae bacterium]|nr:hypothetical protein [Tepidisphaeraceae bacterium]
MSGTKSGGLAVLVFTVAGLGGRAVAADGEAPVPARPAVDAREGVVRWLAPEPVLSAGQREEIEALSNVIDAGDAR